MYKVSLLFEVEDLSQASPATVSRAGMIYLNVEDLGWWPYAESWLQRKVAAKVDPVSCYPDLHFSLHMTRMCQKI